MQLCRTPKTYQLISKRDNVHTTERDAYTAECDNVYTTEVRTLCSVYTTECDNVHTTELQNIVYYRTY